MPATTHFSPRRTKSGPPESPVQVKPPPGGSRIDGPMTSWIAVVAARRCPLSVPPMVVVPKPTSTASSPAAGGSPPTRSSAGCTGASASSARSPMSLPSSSSRQPGCTALAIAAIRVPGSSRRWPKNTSMSVTG